ncbi:MAG: hypothetical protein U9Q82_14220 [Chloroflexota bacterium]|nr:hypothetical protein [Chloroflexota bacterium]
MSRWIRFFIAILIGIGIGLLYAWVLNPVEYVDTTPNSLRGDYQSDYVLMVAEVYQVEQDPTLAVQQLAFLGNKTPLKMVQGAIDFGNQEGYPKADLAVLKKLLQGLQSWAPTSEGTTP